ncbi:FtsW/RodA/SpoVE family cell cycle protein [Haloferula sp. BvORR071]|uniref:FtsW/RodA/SpoVE family cell cycle protein n=1 Tax=Haloferula sp. BvORR071 TaxID=1396141 RepID=UPI00094638FA|nr:FtsW/RodA/SpoVE family cell cycle protein [Haloferula sp. BvORR071]
MTPLFRKLLGLNWPLILTMYGLLAFGVFCIESAARHLPNGGAWYAERQRMWILVGSVIYFSTALIDYRWYRWVGLPVWIVGLGLMTKVNDVAQVDFGSFSFQPAQIVLAGGLLLTAWLLQDLPRLGRLIPKIGWLLEEPFLKTAIIGVISGISFLVVMKMGDMGSAIVWLPLAGVSLLVAGVPFRYLSSLALLGVALVPIAYFIALPAVSKRGPERIETYLNMLHGHEEKVDILAEGYAAHRVSVAVGKAGWLGTGWMADVSRGSLHAKGFIPQKTAHNDYIFAVIAEEQGFRGSLLLLSSFALLLVLCLFIGTYARDPLGRLLVGGAVSILFAHIFENIGMCVLLMPITGIPLPLISYSGTFVVICMFLLGLVQSVWVHRDAGRVVEEEPAAAPVIIGPARSMR